MRRGKTSLKRSNLASGWCLLQGQVTQNEKLIQEHFIRAYPAQTGKKMALIVFHYFISMITDEIFIYIILDL